MKRKVLPILTCLLAACLLSACGDTPTITELSGSDAIFTIDTCEVTGSLSGCVLSMHVSYTVTNISENPVSEITLLTPHLDESAMRDLELQLEGESYPLQLKEKDVIALPSELSPDEQLSISFTYHLDDLPLPEDSRETWRITLPTLEKSAVSTGVGTVDIRLEFDTPLQMVSSVPKGLVQQNDLLVTGELVATVNVLVVDLQ